MDPAVQNPSANLTAETAAISFILRNDKGGELMSLPPYFFDDPLIKKLYEFILEYYVKNSKVPSLPVISASISDIFENQSEIERFQTLVMIIHKTDVSYNDKEILIKALKQGYQSRLLYQSQLSASSLIAAGKINQACELLSQAVDSVEKEEETLENVDNLGDLLHEVEVEKPKFVPTGFPTLDEVTGGFSPGELVIISAPRGSGKSTLMMQLAVNSCSRGHKPVYVNLEMSRREWTCRLFSNITLLPYTKIRRLATDEREKALLRFRVGLFYVKEKTAYRDWFVADKRRLIEMPAVDFYKELSKFEFGGNITHLGPESASMTKLIAKLRNLRRSGSDLVLVDYLSWIKYGPSHYKQHERLGEAALKLKDIAKSLEMPVIVATQVTEEGNVKYSRAVEDHADQIIMWNEVHDRGQDPWRFSAVMTKSRNSPMCSIYLEAMFSKMTIREVAPNSEGEVQHEAASD